MKRIVTIMAALSLTAAAAQAAGINTTTLYDRPEPAPTAVEAVQKLQVKAGTVLTGKELSQAGLSADDIITVSDFSTAGARVSNER